MYALNFGRSAQSSSGARFFLLMASSLVVLMSASAFPAHAAVTWDSFTLDEMGDPQGHMTSSWFDPVNWSTANTGTAAPFYLPPSNDVGAVTDILINALTAPSTEVVYDPSPSNPDFAAITNNPSNYQMFPTGYGPQTIWRLYMGREAAGQNNTGLAKLVIRGDLQTDQTGGDTRWQIGRTSGTALVAANALIVQEAGVVKNNYGDLDLGSIDSLVTSFGNGTYDYMAGTFEHGLDNDPLVTRRLRLSAGGSTGVGGVGKFIMRNPGSSSGGYVRVESFQVAPFGGQNGIEPNGTTNGVGIVEFHALSDGTRPIQVDSLLLGNGQDVADSGVRASQLRIVLDQAPMVNGSGVPINMGLFDVDWDNNGVGAIVGPGTSSNSFGLTFSNPDAVNPLAASAVYDNLVDAVNLVGTADNIVTAMFGASTYRWRIHYDGNISWSNQNSSLISSITGAGTGRDIVLIGLDSMIVDEGLAGDYNDDGVVDAVDYTVWRNNLGDADETNLNNNGDGNDVSASDYTYWKDRYGDVAPPGAGGLAGSIVPEPSAVLLSLLAMVGVTCGSRRGRAVA